MRRMIDLESIATRSRIMRAVRQRGTDVELRVRRAVNALRIRWGANAASLPGSPDLANVRRRWAIFVHGCFWHGHRNCQKTKGGANGRIPASNRGFWSAKLSANRERDARKARELRCLGFRVLTIWECESRDSVRLERKLRRFFSMVPG